MYPMFHLLKGGYRYLLWHRKHCLGKGETGVSSHLPHKQSSAIERVEGAGLKVFSVWGLGVSCFGPEPQPPLVGATQSPL